MTLNLPDDLPVVQGMSQQELLAELAVSLYAGRKATAIQAADLAGMSLFEFQQFLHRHGVAQSYDESALADDIRNSAEFRP